MAKREITDTELALILEALEDAAYYRDARSHVLKSAVRRTNRRSGASPTPPTDSGSLDVHQRKAKAYQALAASSRTSLLKGGAPPT
jgi:hypothetical protein